MDASDNLEKRIKGAAKRLNVNSDFRSLLNKYQEDLSGSLTALDVPETELFQRLSGRLRGVTDFIKFVEALATQDDYDEKARQLAPVVP